MQIRKILTARRMRPDLQHMPGKATRAERIPALAFLCSEELLAGDGFFQLLDRNVTGALDAAEHDDLLGVVAVNRETSIAKLLTCFRLPGRHKKPRLQEGI